MSSFYTQFNIKILRHVAEAVSVTKCTKVVEMKFIDINMNYEVETLLTSQLCRELCNKDILSEISTE